MFQASSDEYSLGEEEDLELFMAKPRKQILEEMKNKHKSKMGIKTCASRLPAISDDEEIDVADMLRAAPPIANANDIEDFDAIWLWISDLFFFRKFSQQPKTWKLLHPCMTTTNHALFCLCI